MAARSCCCCAYQSRRERLDAIESNACMTAMLQEEKRANGALLRQLDRVAAHQTEVRYGNRSGPNGPLIRAKAACATVVITALLSAKAEPLRLCKS